MMCNSSRIDSKEAEKAEMINMRLQGERLWEIGKLYGISRQRVHQLTCSVTQGLLKSKDVRRILKISDSAISWWIKNKGLNPIRIGGNYYFRREEVHRPKCRMCGIEVGKKRQAFCNEKCRNRWQYLKARVKKLEDIVLDLSGRFELTDTEVRLFQKAQEKLEELKKI